MRVFNFGFIIYLFVLLESPLLATDNAEILALEKDLLGLEDDTQDDLEEVNFELGDKPSVVKANFSVKSCKVTKKVQYCTIKGNLGKKNDRVSVYNKGFWLASGLIIKVKKELVTIKISESFEKIQKGNLVVNASSKFPSLEWKHSYSKSQ